MPLRSDIWRIGIVGADIGRVAAAGLERLSIAWTPETPPFTFLADPFGLSRGGRTYVFAEAYDYRTRRGLIDVMELDEGGLGRRRTVLAEPWHLSYPFVFEADDEVWMTPEAHRSGVLRLYRATAFPERWEPAACFVLDTPAIDPTPFQYGGLWWLAYSPSGPQAWKQGRLHLAWAERLTGPWTPHRGNPVRTDRSGSRPGGTPFLKDGRLVLPTQDCRTTYGAAVRLLEIDVLTPERFEARPAALLAPPASAGAYRDGLHTLSACGDFTLVDAKRIDRSLGGLSIDVGRRLGRWRG
jgi:hypothetical protein